MMTPDQVQIVTKVYRKFYENDNKNEEWTPVDESMSLLDWLTNDELVQETEIRYFRQKNGNPRCGVDHPGKECFVPIVLDAVLAILDLYKETKNLHPNNRFVLQYYLSLSHVGAIRS